MLERKQHLLVGIAHIWWCTREVHRRCHVFEVDPESFTGTEEAHLGTGLICRADRDILKVKINPSGG